MKRRNALKQLGLGIGAVSIPTTLIASSNQKEILPFLNKGNINHSACRWCYQSIPLEELAKKGKEIGLKAIDLLTPNEWKIAQKHGLECSLGTDVFANIKEGFNDVKNHQNLQTKYKKLISQAAENNVKQVIVFSGNRNGKSDEEGIENCAKGLAPLIKHAEANNITIIMELLNSKVDHHDYQCDKTEWGVQLADKIGSDNFKLLYDIYHMQIMEGDVIATIRKYHKYIGHYHTGGVPGRNEINNNQELNYPAIMKAIVKTGFKGYVAQEFIPTYPDKLSALKEGVSICDV